jgi:hypothetical protein
VIEHGRRRVHIAGITAHPHRRLGYPTGLQPSHRPRRPSQPVPVPDPHRDSKFTTAFDAVFTGADIRIIRPPYRTERELRRRQDAASPAARDRAQRANRRLHARWAAFDARLKLPVIANTAIARELASWCWSLAVLDD